MTLLSMTLLLPACKSCEESRQDLKFSRNTGNWFPSDSIISIRFTDTPGNEQVFLQTSARSYYDEILLYEQEDCDKIRYFGERAELSLYCASTGKNLYIKFSVEYDPGTGEFFFQRMYVSCGLELLVPVSVSGNAASDTTLLLHYGNYKYLETWTDPCGTKHEHVYYRSGGIPAVSIYISRKNGCAAIQYDNTWWCLAPR